MVPPEVVAAEFDPGGVGGQVVDSRRRWRISYASIEAIVCTLDVALSVSASVLAGVIFTSLFYESESDFVRYISTAVVVSAIFIPILRSRGLYEPSALINWGLQLRNVAVVWSLTFLVFSGAAFALKIGTDFSRGSVLLFAITGLAGLLLHRAFWRSFIRSSLRNGTIRGRRSVLLSLHELPTAGQIDRNILNDLQRYGFDVRQLFHPNAGETPEELVERVITSVRGSEIEEVFVAADLQRWARIRDLVQRLCDLPLPLTLLPDEKIAMLFQRTSRRLGSTVGVEFQRAPLSLIERFSKRLLDVTVAMLGIVVLMPMFVIVALAVKLDSPGPALFLQTRRGFNSKKFKILKFRTMTVLEDGATIKQAERHDKRVTRLGAWLRSTSIDELPQLFNVLLGDMSIVGPRPHAAAHDCHFEELVSRYAFRHHMKPGITGWAQVQGYRGETPTVQAMQERVDHDIWYIDNWTIFLDMQIIARTVTELVRRRNAY
jgi:putative colanic acid biosynthesis UDP-glucose lipid carrier transferase